MSRRTFLVSSARLLREVGSFFFNIWEVANNATPPTPVIGSGAMISAMPAFFIVPLSDPGFVNLFSSLFVGVGSR